MRQCPKCGSAKIDVRSDIVYKRQCQDCLYTDEEEAFESFHASTWSWHLIDHGGGTAWQVIQVEHRYRERPIVTNLAIRLTRKEAEGIRNTMLATAPVMGRKLHYE